MFPLRIVVIHKDGSVFEEGCYYATVNYEEGLIRYCPEIYKGHHYYNEIKLDRDDIKKVRIEEFQPIELKRAEEEL